MVSVFRGISKYKSIPLKTYNGPADILSRARKGGAGGEWGQQRKQQVGVQGVEERGERCYHRAAYLRICACAKPFETPGREKRGRCHHRQ